MNSRREFLWRFGGGLGGMALAQLLGADHLLELFAELQPSVLLCNAMEAAAMGGEVDPETIGARLTVIKHGAGPAVLLQPGHAPIEVPALSIDNVRDTTGAGDVFHAAFAWGLLEGLAPEPILRAANAAAAMSCRSLGAQGGLPSRDELAAFLQTQRPSAWCEPVNGGA